MRGLFESNSKTRLILRNRLSKLEKLFLKLTELGKHFHWQKS